MNPQEVHMKDVEQLKKEIRALINGAAAQGVLITEITAEFATVMEGRGAVTHIQIKETRLK